LKLLQFDSRDTRLIQDSYQQVLTFMDGLHLSSHLSPTNIQSALQAAHTAADEYYTVRHALAWNTDFVIPADAIVADSILFQEYGYDFARMCRHKQSKLSHNCLSVERIQSIFGATGTHIPGVSSRDVNTQ